jgi:hypothetical protein
LPVKVGMSASASIRASHLSGVIQVPSRAIQTLGPFKSIQVLYGKDKTPVTVEVTTGATDGQMTEITGCVKTGSQCLREGDTVALTLPDATTTGNQSDPGEGVFQIGVPAGGGGPESGGTGGPNLVIRTGPGPGP